MDRRETGMRRVSGIRRLWLAGMVAAATLLPSLSTGAAAGWTTYRNESAGFAIKYPAGWSAQVRWQSGSNLDVILRPPGQSSGIDVAVRPPLPRFTTEPNDSPDTACRDIAAHGITGTYCLIAPSSTAITTFVTRDRAYRLSASLQHVVAGTYRRVVRSFRLLS